MTREWDSTKHDRKRPLAKGARKGSGMQKGVCREQGVWGVEVQGRDAHSEAEGVGCSQNRKDLLGLGESLDLIPGEDNAGP